MVNQAGRSPGPISPGATVKHILFSRSTIIPLAAVWTTVLLVNTVLQDLLTSRLTGVVAGALFVLILAAIVVAAFGVVREAEHLARALGDLLGTLVLTLSVVLIEVILISSVMLGPAVFPTIARDALFSVMMIILNGVTGMALLLGGLKHGAQAFNRQGASAYLVMIFVLTLLSLVLPNFTSSTTDGSLIPVQAIGLAVFFAVIYGFFLILQVGKHREMFVQPGDEIAAEQLVETQPDEDSPEERGVRRATVITRSVLIVVCVLPIVLLSQDLAPLLDYGIESLNAPIVLSGVLIALIVFTPEAITAIRASLNNETQRMINLNLGAFVSTLGFTIPSVLLIGLITGHKVILGESPANMLLIVVTLALCVITFTSQRTTAIHGAGHLMLFAMFVLLIFAP